jgi:hypothetical protein
LIHGETKDGGYYTAARKVYPVFQFCKHDVRANGGHRILQTGSCCEISLESCIPTTPSKIAAAFKQIAQEILNDMWEELASCCKFCRVRTEADFAEKIFRLYSLYVPSLRMPARVLNVFFSINPTAIHN